MRITKRLKLTFSVLLLLGISLVLSGCQGGGCNNPATISTATITGTVYVPSEYTVAAKAPSTWEKLMALFATPKAAAATEEVPLAGAKVVVINFADGVPYADLVATTDSNGKYSISGLPGRADVVVVVTAKISDTEEIRLTRVLTDISGSVPGDINSASSLAAEELCTLMNKGKNLTSGEATRIFEAARTAVEEILAEGGTIDLRVSGNLFKANLGDGLAVTETDLNYDKIIVVLGSMPAGAAIDVTDLEYARLRAAVQDIRSLGVSMATPLDGRFLVFNEKFTKAMDWTNHVRYDWASMLADIFYECLLPAFPDGNGLLQTDWNTSYTASGTRSDDSLSGKWKIMYDPNQDPTAVWTQAVETWLISRTGTNSFSFSATDVLGAPIASGSMTLTEDAFGPKMNVQFEYIKDALITEQATATVGLLSDGYGSWNPRSVVFSCSSFNYEEDMSAMAGGTGSTATIPLFHLTSNDVAPYGSLDFTGSMSMVMDGYAPKYTEVAGDLSMGDGTSCDVKYAITVTNTADYFGNPDWEPVGTEAVEVFLKLPDQLPVLLKASIPLVSSGQTPDAYTFSYTRDSCILKGSIAVNSATNEATIELSNQDGVIIRISADGSGHIISGTMIKGNTTATIDNTSGVVTITYQAPINYVETL